jgi:hypothetical protein
VAEGAAVNSPNAYAKSIIGGLIAGLSALGGAVTAGDGTLASVDASGWIAAALAFLTGLVAVWAAPNEPVEPPQWPVVTGPLSPEEEFYGGSVSVNETTQGP